MGHILSVLPQSRQDRRKQVKTKIAGIYCYYEKYRLTETIHTDTCPATQIGHLGLVHTECIVIPCIMDLLQFRVLHFFARFRTTSYSTKSSHSMVKESLISLFRLSSCLRQIAILVTRMTNTAASPIILTADFTVT